MHAFKTKISGTLCPLFCFLTAFSKALILHKAEEYVLNEFGSIALHKSLLETKKIEFFYSYMNYTMITNHAHARTNPPFPLGEPESKKIDFNALFFASSEIRKTINVYVI